MSHFNNETTFWTEPISQELPICPVNGFLVESTLLFKFNTYIFEISFRAALIFVQIQDDRQK